MSLNKYDSAGFAARLRERFPNLYGSAQWSDDEINENWLQSHPENIANLTSDAQSKYVDFHSQTGTYSLKGTATQEILNESYDPTAWGDIKRVVHGIKSVGVTMPGWFVSMPAQTRSMIQWFDEQTKKGHFQDQLGIQQDEVVGGMQAGSFQDAGTAETTEATDLSQTFAPLNAIADASLNVSEYMREHTDKWADDWIANDTELQAYFAWKEDNPYSWDDLSSAGSAFRAFKNGIIDMAPSVLMMMAPGGIAKAGGMIGRGFGLAKLTKGAQSMYNASNSLGIGVMFAMEGGGTYNESMRYLVNEKGMDAKDAIGLAGVTAALYAPVSTYLEKLQFNSMLRMLGLSKRADKVMLSSIMNSIAGKAGVEGLTKTARKHALSKVGLGALDISLATFEQGVVEGWQTTWNHVITESMQQGFGADPKSATNEMLKALQGNLKKQAVMPWLSEDEEVRQSFFSALFGSVLPGGFSMVGNSRKAYKRYLEGLEAGQGGGFKVEVEGTRVTVYNKNGEFVSVYEAGSEEAAQQSAKDYKQQIQDEAIVHYVETMGEADDLDSLLENLDIEIEDGSFDSIEGYAKNLAYQLKEGLTEINSWMKDPDGELSPLQQLIKDGTAHDGNVGLKALNLIKHTKNMNVFRDAGLAEDAINAIEAAAVVALNTLTANSLMKRLKPGKKVSLAIIDKALRNVSPKEVLAHIENGTYESDLLPILLKAAKIEVRAIKGRRKLTKENAEEFDNALDEQTNQNIDRDPDTVPDIQISQKEALEKKLEGKDFSEINSKKLTIENVKDFLRYTFLKSGSTKLAGELHKLSKTSIYKLAKKLGLKITKKSISTDKMDALNAIAKKLMQSPLDVAAETAESSPENQTKDDPWEETEEPKPVKKKVKKKAKKKAPPKKRKETKATKEADEVTEKPEVDPDDPVRIKKQIASIKRRLKSGEKLDKQTPAVKKELKRLKVLLGQLEVKLNAIEKKRSGGEDKFAKDYIDVPSRTSRDWTKGGKAKLGVALPGEKKGKSYSLDTIPDSILKAQLKQISENEENIRAGKAGEGAYEALRIIESELARRKKLGVIYLGEVGKAVPMKERESGEAEAREFVEEGEDDGWGVPQKTQLSKEELDEVRREMGTPGKGGLSGSSTKTKGAGKTAAQKAEDKIDDELCW